MGTVQSNTIGLSSTKANADGSLPATPVWRRSEPNNVGAGTGPTFARQARQPLSPSRQNRKSVTTGLDVAASFESDITIASIEDFAEGIFFTSYVGGAVFTPTAVTANSYTVPSGGALDQNTLVYARGFTNSGNNGLKPVGSGSTSTSVNVSGLTAEAMPPRNALLEVAGFRGSTGDLEIDSDGNLISTTLDFTDLPIIAGQMIHIGGLAAANRFAGATNTGYAQAQIIEANKITLAFESTTFAEDDGSGRSVDLLYGRVLRNVEVGSTNYNEQNYWLELSFPNLGDTGATLYRYIQNCRPNEITFTYPLEGLATLSYGFIGLAAPNATATRQTNAQNALIPTKTSPLSTAIDLPIIRIPGVDPTGTQSCFKNITFTINNNITAAKCLGSLQARNLNAGNFTVSIEAQLELFNTTIEEAIRNNTTLSFELTMRNDDGAISLIIPEMTFGDGSLEYPENEAVLINGAINAHQDARFNTSLIMSFFPVVPA